jgi:prevent-host-death family protein
MSQDSYSTYEAKARFSELLRKVRSGQSVSITYRGEPVAELRPIERPEGTRARIEHLARRGLVTEPPKRVPFKPVARRPGALDRFLAERDDGSWSGRMTSRFSLLISGKATRPGRWDSPIPSRPEGCGRAAWTTPLTPCSRQSILEQD